VEGLIRGQGVCNITYIHIHECDNFSVSRNMFNIYYYAYDDFFFFFSCFVDYEISRILLNLTKPVRGSKVI
jgi:hypothetical protein